jgi:hypothetical protein
MAPDGKMPRNRQTHQSESHESDAHGVSFPLRDRGLDFFDADRGHRTELHRRAHGRLEIGAGVIVQEHDDAILLALIEYLRSSHDALAGSHALVLIDADPDHVNLPSK